MQRNVEHFGHVRAGRLRRPSGPKARFEDINYLAFTATHSNRRSERVGGEDKY